MIPPSPEYNLKNEGMVATMKALALVDSAQLIMLHRFIISQYSLGIIWEF